MTPGTRDQPSIKNEVVIGHRTIDRVQRKDEAPFDIELHQNSDPGSVKLHGSYYQVTEPTGAGGMVSAAPMGTTGGGGGKFYWASELASFANNLFLIVWTPRSQLQEF
jgi:hypothetical protein